MITYKIDNLWSKLLELQNTARKKKDYYTVTLAGILLSQLNTAGNSIVKEDATCLLYKNGYR